MGGHPRERSLCDARQDPAPDPDRAREQRYRGHADQRIPAGRAPAQCSTDHVSGLQPWRTISARGSLSSACEVVSAVKRKMPNDGRRFMSKTTPEQNKALVLEAFDTLFNKRDYTAAERYWSDRYIQHSAHIAPGREGLFNLIRTLPDTLKYENQLIVAEGDYVIAHGRFSGNGRPAAWVAADIVRIEDGKLAEHWDVLQDEATKAQSVSGLPMFGDRFPNDLQITQGDQS